jgi:hypothetical protein
MIVEYIFLYPILDPSHQQKTRFAYDQVRMFFEKDLSFSEYLRPVFHSMELLFLNSKRFFSAFNLQS